jgi:hypothetical protein
MSIKLTGYELLTGKIVHRPWGVEYRFTAVASDERHLNDVVGIFEKATDEEISAIIQSHLKKIDVPPSEPVDEIVTLEIQKAILLAEIDALESEKTTLEKAVSDLIGVK